MIDSPASLPSPQPSSHPLPVLHSAPFKRMSNSTDDLFDCRSAGEELFSSPARLPPPQPSNDSVPEVPPAPIKRSRLSLNRSAGSSSCEDNKNNDVWAPVSITPMSSFPSSQQQVSVITRRPSSTTTNTEAKNSDKITNPTKGKTIRRNILNDHSYGTTAAPPRKQSQQLMDFYLQPQPKSKYQ